MKLLKHIRLPKLVLSLSMLLALVTLSGCSTMLAQTSFNADVQSGNQCSEPYIYGGAAIDAMLFIDGAKTTLDVPAGGLMMMTYSVIDLPFSFVADTVSLPVTVYRSLANC